MLIAEIIGVLSLNHLAQNLSTSIYDNIKILICLTLIDENHWISLWVYFGKMLPFNEPPAVSISPYRDCNPRTVIIS